MRKSLAALFASLFALTVAALPAFGADAKKAQTAQGLVTTVKPPTSAPTVVAKADKAKKPAAKAKAAKKAKATKKEKPRAKMEDAKKV